MTRRYLATQELLLKVRGDLHETIPDSRSIDQEKVCQSTKADYHCGCDGWRFINFFFSMPKGRWRAGIHGGPETHESSGIFPRPNAGSPENVSEYK